MDEEKIVDEEHGHCRPHQEVAVGGGQREHHAVVYQEGQEYDHNHATRPPFSKRYNYFTRSQYVGRLQ